MNTNPQSEPQKSPDPVSAAEFNAAELTRKAEALDSWSDVLQLFCGHYTTPEMNRAKVIAMGDIHGIDPNLIKEDLQRVGFLDSDFKVSNARGRIFVQMGDVVDRGLWSREDYEYLRELQQAAPDHVVRLIGNHDFAHLIGFPERINARPIRGLQQMLIDDIVSGKVLLAWSEGDTIYSHAGIDLDFYPEYRGLSNAEIVTDLNQRLRNAVSAYAAALSAGADAEALADALVDADNIFDTSNGILWTRERIDNEQFRQVVGHTPQMHGIAESTEGRVMYIDTARVFAERGQVDLDHGRQLFANSQNSVGIQHLARHPEIHRKHRERRPPP